jgi:hypothetical protein
MKRTVRQLSISLLAVLAVLLAVVGLVLGRSTPAPVKAAPLAAGNAAPAAQKPDNSQCLSCHGQAGDQVHQFPNGDTVSVLVEAQTYDQAVHAEVACQVCHTNITGFPHPQNAAASAKTYTEQYKDTCKQCHRDQAEDVMGSAHAVLARDGNSNTPICADCHNPHTQVKIQKDANGDPAPVENARIAETCAQCHSEIVNEYKNSVHGKGVFLENNPDVPACHDCHGIHKISTARTAEFRLNSPQLCANCHAREDIMGKYKISTQVLNTYVSDFHGTTVTLFRHENPELATNKPVCYDCHGVHNIASVKDPEKGLEVRQNMLVACQKCHPDATENFPDSWMSHYIASPTRFPIVFYVGWFYKIFIPAVLGGMGLFVLADILRKVGITRRRKPTAVKAREE